MGFCTPDEYLEFMRQRRSSSGCSCESGIHMVKFWFSVSRGTSSAPGSPPRSIDPVKQWKLSPTDLASLDKWDAYTEAKEAMFFYTDTPHAPWTVVKINDKKRARIEAMRCVLPQIRLHRQGPAGGRHPRPAPHRFSRNGLRRGRAPGRRVSRRLIRRPSPTAPGSGSSVSRNSVTVRGRATPRIDLGRAAVVEAEHVHRPLRSAARPSSRSPACSRGLDVLRPAPAVCTTARPVISA